MKKKVRRGLPVGERAECTDESLGLLVLKDDLYMREPE
jgi:hypothetical protein